MNSCFSDQFGAATAGIAKNSKVIKKAINNFIYIYIIYFNKIGDFMTRRKATKPAKAEEEDSEDFEAEVDYMEE